MANILDKYSDTLNETMASPANPVVNAKAQRQHILRKRDIRAIKALTKALREHNKLVKEEVARRKAADAAEHEAATKQQTAESGRGQNGKDFLNKLGDAICKAVPRVLTALASSFFGWLIKRSTEKILKTS